MRRAAFVVWIALFVLGCTQRSLLPAPALPLVPTPKESAPTRPDDGVGTTNVVLPEVKSLRLSNGFAVYAIERHELPHVALSYVSLRGGEDAQDLETAGLASIVTELMVAGYDDGANGVTVQSGSSGAPDYVAFRAQTLRHTSTIATMVETGQLEGAVQLLGRIVREPKLDARTLHRARQRARDAWRAEQWSPSGVAYNHLMQRIYGPVHVLGQHADMAVKRVDAHDLDAVIAGYHARHAPSDGALVVVGDVQLEALRPLIEQVFGSWSEKAPRPKTYAPSDWEPRGKRKVFLHAQLRQTHFVVGQRAPAPTSADYVALQALTHVLGGSYSSRLMTALRRQRGATYFVHASLSPRRDGSTLVIQTAVPRDLSQPAFAKTLDEIRRLQAAPVTAEELARTVATLSQETAARYETTSGAADELMAALELGLDPQTSAQKRLDTLLGLTPEALREVARRVLSPERAPAIIVGDLRPFGSNELHDWSSGDDEML